VQGAFCKNLAKEFRFSAEKPATLQTARGKYLYNPQAFGEIPRAFNVD
jgi:hypothetical protein